MRNKELQKGFTLIELLIVIAVLGILAAAVLVAINPLEQFARGRDAGRKSTIDQVGHAIQNYYTAQNGQFPPLSGTPGSGWMDALITAQELKNAPTNTGTGSYVTTCTNPAVAENGWCYNVDITNGNAVVYARVESKAEALKANNSATTPCTTTAWVVWSSSLGKTGDMCSNTDPRTAPTTLY